MNGRSCQQRTSRTSSTNEAENDVKVDATTYGRVSTNSRSKNGTKLQSVHKNAFPKSYNPKGSFEYDKVKINTQIYVYITTHLLTTESFSFT